MRLRVATLNTWGLPYPFGKDVKARMRAIVERLPAYELDVLGLQEVWTAKARRKLIAGARRAGLVHACSSPDASWNLGGGLLLLSREPMRDVRFGTFDVRGDVERLEQAEYFGGKGYLRGVLEHPAGPVQFVTTHLHARYRDPTRHEYRPHRTAQLVQIGTEALDPALPAVVMGDFNLMEQSPEYQILREVIGLADPPVELGQREATVYAANPYRLAKRARGGPSRRKDYVFRRDGIDRALVPVEAERVFDEQFELSGEPAAPSDHAGVLVEFDVVPGLSTTVARPPSGSLALAERLLQAGREAALQRESSQTGIAWAGIAAALAAVGSARAPAVSRRRFARGALRAGAALALLPATSMGLASRVVLPREVEAFDRAARRLNELEHQPRAVASGVARRRTRSS